MLLPACINLSGDKSVARLTLDSMSAENKRHVDIQIEKTLKKKINREVKGTILNVAHRKQLESMNMEHLTKSVVETGEMIHPLKPTIDKLLRTDHAMKVGDWCEVLYECAPGTCSDGDVGTIMEISRDDENRAWCTVSYVLDKRIETRIDQKRITVTIMPYKDTTSRKRVGREVETIEAEAEEERKYEPLSRTPIEWLQVGLKSRTHERRGWLKEKLLRHGLLEATPEALWKRILSDYKCQLSGIVKRSNFHNKRKADSKGVNNLTDGYKKRVQFNKGDCVITNRAASRRHYNPRYFFLRLKALAGTIPIFKDDTMNYLNTEVTCYRRPEWRHYTQRVTYWNEVYDAIMADQCSLNINEDMQQYEKMVTMHDARQPFIEEELVEAIKSYNCVTYRQLAGHINNWCQHSCIMNWLHSHETYSLREFEMYSIVWLQ